MMRSMEKLLIFAKSNWFMEIGQKVNISPYLTHLNDWVTGEIIEVEDNPYRGTVIAAKDVLGRVFWGEQDYFKLIDAEQGSEELMSVVRERLRQLEAGEVRTIPNTQVFSDIREHYGF